MNYITNEINNIYICNGFSRSVRINRSSARKSFDENTLKERENTLKVSDENDACGYVVYADPAVVDVETVRVRNDLLSKYELEKDGTEDIEMPFGMIRYFKHESVHMDGSVFTFSHILAYKGADSEGNILAFQEDEAKDIAEFIDSLRVEMSGTGREKYYAFAVPEISALN